MPTPGLRSPKKSLNEIDSERFSIYDTNKIYKKAQLCLEDGTIVSGISFGAIRSVSGEVVFNTGMVGYPESLTDPSYRGQILILTYPLIGNYGVPDNEIDKHGILKNFESSKIQITALIVCDYSPDYSHRSSRLSLSDWLIEHNIPALYAIDTRELTKKIRNHGSMLGKIVYNNEQIPFENVNLRNLVSEVSNSEIRTYGNGKFVILVVDCGIKNNIIRFFLKKDVTLKVVPWNYDFSNEICDGLFLSNGPGDPEILMDTTVKYLQNFLEKEQTTPVFGICLGHQLLALATGAQTRKMKFGNRGMNQPVIDLRTTKCYITAQNHGFEVDATTLTEDWEQLFINRNDRSNEGIIHRFKPFFSVQFHPEAMAGPTDTHFLFDYFLRQVSDKRTMITTVPITYCPDVRKILILGSGGLSIGQAGEFDYSGSQAIKAIKEENLVVVLVNPNIATVQTSAQMADFTYFEPLTPDFVTKVIEKERPDGILLQFGGQTALNCGVKLQNLGIFDKYNVKVLGTSIKTIIATEDRKIFAEKLAEINECIAPSETATTVENAIEIAEKLGYPVLVRAAFALGGIGSGFASNRKELEKLVQKSFATSNQIIVDKSLEGWKEVEYEVVRDCMDNCVAICNMENFDPLGVHTGDSIVVVPSQTLTNREYFMLRDVAIKVVRHLGVVGECNIQFALNPLSDEYCIIEVNARLSRSSALASKASGYPLAYVAAKLSLGIHLTEIKNTVTKKTYACFEPSLDYVIVKFPRWDIRKFSNVSNTIGSSMKSVGEVMAIGRKFEEAFQKAIRMVDGTVDGFGDDSSFDSYTNEQLNACLKQPNNERCLAISAAFKRGYSVKYINNLTHIDKWFLHKLFNIINAGNALSQYKNNFSNISRSTIVFIKTLGFSDKQIGRLTNISEFELRKYRKENQIFPFVKQIDTVSAEFPAETNYLYMTYNGDCHDPLFNDNGIMVLGCGAYRIGSSCEFDWSAVSCIRTLKNLKLRSIMINYNPETVSTDFDECDRLYFEELSLERILDIYEIENSSGAILSVGGQIPNNLAVSLKKNGVRIFGTQPESINNAENRFLFSELLDKLRIDQPQWTELTSIKESQLFAEKVGYPVLVRPSYVLSGSAMNVVHNNEDLVEYLNQASVLSPKYPVVVSKFIGGAKEIEIDAVANDGNLLNYAISEHVENAGVHSGDATLILPAQKLYVRTIKRIKQISSVIASALKITGPFNIQFLSKDNEIKVIECNLRASRSFPFVSKVLNTNFIELATKAMCGKHVKPSIMNIYESNRVCVKTPMFSFIRLQGADPLLSVEMTSTGEVACFGKDVYEAYLKSLMCTGFRLPTKTKNILISAGSLTKKVEFFNSVSILQKNGYNLYGTVGTAKFYSENGIDIKTLYKPDVEKEPSVLHFLSNKKIDLVINVHHSYSKNELSNGYKIRRTAIDYSIPLLTDIKSAILFVNAIDHLDLEKLEARSWDEFLDEC